MHRLVPKLLVCLREGYGRRAFLADLAAGVTVGVVALPLAMAFAISSGLTPERGLYTAIVAGFLISALGGSRVQIGGPTGAFVVIVYGIVQRHGYDGLALATLMAGGIVAVMGLARFGAMIKFIPYPVTTGFTSGIALVIFSSQVKDFLGLEMGSVPTEFVEKWAAYGEHASSANPHALGVGAASLVLLVLLRRFGPRVPGTILVVILASAAVWLFRWPVETIGTRFGEIPRTLPVPGLPPFSYEKMRALIPEATTIAMLAAIESLLSAVVADGMLGTRHKSDCELVAQGVANVGAVLFGGFCATGAIARTVTNVKSGGRTPVAGMVHAATIALVMLLLAPYASRIPLAALASILIVVAWNMSEVDHFRALLKAPRSDVAVLLTTFSLTVFVDLTVAVGVGLVLASLLFMRQMAELSGVAVVSRELGDGEEEAAEIRDARAFDELKVPPGVEVFQMNGPFFFGMAHRLQDVLGRLESPPRVFVLRMRRVPVIDATGLHALDDFRKRCARHGTRLLLSGVQPALLPAFERSGFLEGLGRDGLCRDVHHALEKARALLGQPA
ncbi:MAG: SulP family inorganic anion transporter [Planctomycetota bacterium]